ACFKRTLLAVAKRHVTGFRRRQVPPPRRQVLELEAPLRIGADETIGAQFTCLGADLCTADRRSVVCGHDAAADHCGTRGLIAAEISTRRVARRQLPAACLSERTALRSCSCAALPALRHQGGGRYPC